MTTSADYLCNEQPIDHERFVQYACDPQTSCVVEACAGSGKTWLLVARILRALLDGCAPGAILAITFTRKAAQEMQQRLRDELALFATAAEADVLNALCARGLSPAQAQARLPLARALYEQVLQAPVPVTVDTFHGWFMQITARAPLGAGVPLAPTLLDNTARVMEQAWQRFFESITLATQARTRAAWLELLAVLGENDARALLTQLVHKRAEWWAFAADDAELAIERSCALLKAALHDAGFDEQTPPAAMLRQPPFVKALATLHELWQQIDKRAVTLNDAIQRAGQWLDSPAPAEQDLAAIASLLHTRERSRKQFFLPEKMAAKVKAQLTAYKAAHEQACATIEQVWAAMELLRALQIQRAGLRCGQLLLESYQQLKSQLQAVDFTDIEWHAHRLLADPETAAYMQARLDARYKQVLLDEFQDTNALQWQVLRQWLAAYDDSDGRPAVFVVGDPKQSIYRFRRAEPRVFEAARELLLNDYGAVHLRTNVTRRNGAAVTALLNRALDGGFALYQTQRTLAAEQGETCLLPLVRAHTQATPATAADDETARAEATSAATDQASAVWRDILVTPRQSLVNDTALREGEQIAAALQYFVSRTEVHGRSGERRAARWRDAIVLVPRRQNLGALEAALRRAGVPYVSDRRGGLLSTLEADDLMALLHALLAPEADLALAHALRSPLFGLDDADLTRIASLAGTTWWERLEQLATSTDCAPVLRRAHRLISHWRKLAGILPVHDLLDRIYHEGEARVRYVATVPPALTAQVQANLDAFIALALEIDAGRYPSLPRFIDELSRLKRAPLEEAPDEGLTDDEDAVRLMTIHGAKGLEAEIVVVADAHRRAKPERMGVLLDWPPEAPVPQHFSLFVGSAPSAHATLAARDQMQRELEHWNLLYVAATRAKQVLVVSGTESNAKGELTDTAYQRLAAGMEQSHERAVPSRASVDQALVDTQLMRVGITASTALAASTASGLAAPVTEPVVARSVHEFNPQPHPTGSRLALQVETEEMRLGSAWHALMENAALGSSDLQARYQLSAVAVQQVMEAATAARRRLAQQVVIERAAPWADLTELDIMTAEGELLRADRVLESAQAIWVVDYKWQLTPALLPSYRRQVLRYVEALQSLRQDKPIYAALLDAQGQWQPISLAADTIAPGGPPRMSVS